jgi:fluoroquinolone resistance protein
MNKPTVEGKTYTKEDFTVNKLEKAEYEHCIFTGCTMLQADLSSVQFVSCEFRSCDLSNANLRNTSFREVKFMDCKLLGLHFQNCEKFLFSASFENCRLDLSSFYKMNMKKALFRNCRFQESDFTECDLQLALFDNCDLGRAIFFHSILEKTDLRTSYNYSIDPEQNKIKKAKFSKEGLSGLLDKYDLEIS